MNRKQGMELGTKTEDNLDEWVKSKSKYMRDDMSDYSVNPEKKNIGGREPLCSTKIGGKLKVKLKEKPLGYLLL